MGTDRVADSVRGPVSAFLDNHFRHFNARELVRAAEAYSAHVDAGGKMLVALAGAISTAEIGLTLGRMIRSGQVHAISCTGANLEEDVFTLLARSEYEMIADWRDLAPSDEVDLLERGMNRVTDTCIPEGVMRKLGQSLFLAWSRAADEGTSRTPAEFMWEALADPKLAGQWDASPDQSWTLAARDAGIPVFVPGWEDSTTGNFFTAGVMSGRVSDHRCVATGTEQFQHVMEWYEEACANRSAPSPGFLQIGGGIAGDFAICAVPCLAQDLGRDVPPWGYFCQITDAEPSYGGYSGAPANEKITWGKLSPDTPRFQINSDASIVAPLIFAHVLGD